MAMQKSVILDIQTWIDNNIDKPLRINDVAHRAGYSKWHLQRLFHQIIDIPLGVYIRNKKLEGAAHDLDLVRGRQRADAEVAEAEVEALARLRRVAGGSRSLCEKI